LEPVIQIVRGLPTDLSAAVFVVIHGSLTSPNVLPTLLGRAGPFPVFQPDDNEPIVTGRLYVARPGYHLLLESGRVRLTRGPKENRFRPAVDPLFRSAALAYGPRVIGVVLSGGLDDGAIGLWAIKTCGGITIVQDPEEALARSMPESALRHTRVDHLLGTADIPSALVRLSAEPATETSAASVPKELEIETRIAMEDTALKVGLGELGEPSIFTCPECHGSLLRLRTGGGLRFRCHTGHAYTANTLLADLTESIENDLWNAVRSIEESSLLMQHFATHLRNSGDMAFAALYDRKAADARRRAERVRQVVNHHESLSGDTIAEKPPDAR
jgi:two-component system chemotaxis response regulator CheB